MRHFCLLLGLAGLADAQGIRLLLTGDSIINRRLSIYSEPDFLTMVERIRGADAAFTNLETVVHDYEAPPASQGGGTYMASPRWVLDELKWNGFDLVAAANNHAGDYGAAGLLVMLRHLEASGLAYAGAGENLARARAPAYLDTGKGRVALIACASTFPSAAAAGQQRPDVKGRPGLNPLRLSTTYVLPRPDLDALRTLLRRLPGGGRSGPLGFVMATFVEGAEPAVKTAPHPADLKAIEASIREARRQADWVIVSVHSHEGAPDSREVPAEFLITFAHAAIDAGADVVAGHGPHVLRGVETYKGKPILYSLANFIFQNETVRFLPAENYEGLGLGLEASPADFYDARSRNDTRGFPADKLYWESVMAEVVFEADRTLREVIVHPITLGHGQKRTERGRPRPAPEPMAAEIVERLSKLSAPLGTQFRFETGRGVLVR